MSSCRDEIFAFCLDAYGVKPDYPFDSEEPPVLRHPRTKKWFAILMRVLPEKLGLKGTDPLPIMNVKCDAETLATLLGSEGFFPAYHMNKSHWLTILLDGTVPLDFILPLVEMSFDLVS